MPAGQVIRAVVAFGALAFAFPVCLWADAVTVWNINANKAANATCIGPSGNGLYESRLYAMVHIAIHDAVNAIDLRSRPYAYDAQAVSYASFDAAVATAAHDVLLDVIGRLAADCIGTGPATVEADYRPRFQPSHQVRRETPASTSAGLRPAPFSCCGRTMGPTSHSSILRFRRARSRE